MNLLNESEKHRLLCLWQAGELSLSEAERLLQTARADDSLLREMAALQKTERLLRHQGAVAASGDLFVEEILAQLRRETNSGNQFTSGVITRLRSEAAGSAPEPRSVNWMSRWGAWAAMIAALALVAGLLKTGWDHRAPVATIIGLEAATWTGNQSPLKEGQPLRRGFVEIAGGFLNLRFISGASVILEGPARLELLGGNRARLLSGKTVAHVPDAAQGFTLESPDGQIIDLGTRFAVEVGAGGGTEVHVLEGLVKAAARGESRMRELQQAQGLRMAAGGATPIPADQTRFLTELPPRPSAAVSFVHWPLDEGQGMLVHDAGRGFSHLETSARLASLVPGAAGPQWTDGRFGSALEFDGVGDFVASDFSGIAGAQARTVALWVRVPQDWTIANGYALVSWGSLRKPGGAWQISINPEAEDGPIGHLRVGIHKGQVIGSRDLRDGQWHHLAAVLYDGPERRTTTHILLYVDGQLEPAYRRSVFEVQTDVTKPGAAHVMLGRNLSPSTPLGQFVFRGTMDEVHIFDAALSQESIREVMQSKFKKP